MENLISFDKLGDVANNLIDKLASAVGWIVSYDTPNKIAINTYVNEIKESNYDPITKAAMISTAKKTIKEYCNQKNIVAIALQNINKFSKPDEINNDWLVQFMDKARLVSDEEFQYIWGRVLAEECNQPNSIPKVAFKILEQMDRDIAIKFMNVCSVAEYVDEDEIEYSPIIIDALLEEYYRGIGITFHTLLELKSYGLVELDVGKGHEDYNITYKKAPVIIHYFDEQYIVPEMKTTFPVGNVLFTKAGRALCKAVNAEKREGFFQTYCVPMWEAKFKNK